MHMRIPGKYNSNKALQLMQSLSHQPAERMKKDWATIPLIHKQNQREA